MLVFRCGVTITLKPEPSNCRCLSIAETLPELGEMVRNNSITNRSSRLNEPSSTSSGLFFMVLSNHDRTTGSPCAGSSRGMML
jgi:hypothetical protein